MALLLIVALSAAAQLQPRQPRKKKNEDKEPPTQTLPLPKDPPGAASAETGKLVFHVSPLSDKGLLTQQTHDALSALMKLNRGAQIVKLRAFVAGTGDMRRVQTIVSEIFTDKKQPLPALSTVQAGALPMEGAQVIVEAISADKRTVNPNGLAFFSGVKGADAAAAIAQLQTAATEAGVAAADMLRVTCFLSSLEAVPAARESVTRAFPGAAADFIQPLRVTVELGAFCEATGRRSQTGADISSRKVAALNPPKLVFSGTQMAFGSQPADLRLAFQRLDKALEPLGVSLRDIVYANSYLLSPGIEEQSAPIRAEFFPREAQAAKTSLLVEGLPSLDATMGIEVIAAAAK